MVDTVTIPLGGLNEIPGVDGIEDVTFDIPQVEDIVDAVVENTIEPVDVGRAVVNEVRSGNLPSPDLITSEIDRAVTEIIGDVEENVTEGLSGVEAAIQSQFGILETELDNVRDALVADIEEVVGTVETEFDSLLEGVESALTDTIGELPGQVDSLVGLIQTRVVSTIDDVETTLTDELADVRSNVETAIDESTEDIDEAVQGVSGALASLGDTLGDVRDNVETLVEDVETTLDRLPEDFETAVGNGVTAVEPTVDESGLFSQPVAFAVALGGAAVEEAITDETAEIIQQASDDR